jgi:hypothetical protein
VSVVLVYLCLVYSLTLATVQQDGSTQTGVVLKRYPPSDWPDFEFPACLPLVRAIYIFRERK